MRRTRPSPDQTTRPADVDARVHAKPEAALESRHRGNRLAAEGLAHQTDKLTIPFAARGSPAASGSDDRFVAKAVANWVAPSRRKQ
jgi:hypothetical protein